MDILILGNGFDLAHNLPTKYSDFLEFCMRVQLIWTYKLEEGQENNFKKEYLDDWQTDKSIRFEIERAFCSREQKLNKQREIEIISNNNILSEIHEMITDNIWYGYFLKLYQEHKINGENWIDFESEIREIIQLVDQKSISLMKSCGDVFAALVSENLFNEKVQLFQDELISNNFNEDGNVKNFREKAYKDLERLIRALELYLSGFVNNINIADKEKIQELENISPEHVLSFNYTDTYKRLYNKGKLFYIHGKAYSKRPMESNDMVLGIDEYWPEGERDKHTNFTIFKKFAQRIQKHTGTDNFEWLNEIRAKYKQKCDSLTGHTDNPLPESDNGLSHVYILGHSLDVTDKDILSELIGDEATIVTVYCKDKGTEGELIANTIELIGEKRLLEKINTNPTKFEFKIIPKK